VYLFTKNKGTGSFVLDNIEFGGDCKNNRMVHLVNSKIPFGRVGNSGIGRYHGRCSLMHFIIKKCYKNRRMV